jgi:AcrR family transcriptional regulator
MPRDKTETNKKILISAKQEFLEHGFEKASMRKIAAQTGITAGGLYRHFSTKAAMFEALVEPTLNKYYQRNKEMTDASIQSLSEIGIQAFREVSDDSNREILDFIYEHYDEFQLMFNCSAGTKFDNIRHDLVMQEVLGARRMIKVLKEQGVSVREFDDEQMHILYSTALTPLFEIITHGYSYERASSFLDLLTDAMNFGWEKILNI